MKRTPEILKMYLLCHEHIKTANNFQNKEETQMKGNVKTEVLNKILIGALVILAIELFGFVHLESEYKEMKWTTHSQVVALRKNTEPYNVPFWMYIEGTGNATRINKLQNYVAKIENEEPEMYIKFLNEGWHFVLTDRDLGGNESANTTIAGQCVQSERCIYIRFVDEKIVWHEFGHYINSVKKISQKRKFREIHEKEWMNVTDAYNLLTVNTSTPGEYFAEMYAYYRINGIDDDKIAPMTKKLFEDLIY